MSRNHPWPPSLAHGSAGASPPKWHPAPSLVVQLHSLTTMSPNFQATKQQPPRLVPFNCLPDWFLGFGAHVALPSRLLRTLALPSSARLFLPRMASSAVHPLGPGDDDGGREAASGLTAPTEGVLASSCSRVWPSVSDSDEEGKDGKGDGKGDGGRITYPKIYDGSDAGLDGGVSESCDVVKGGDEGEILELVEGVRGCNSGGSDYSGVYEGGEGVIDEKVLEDLRAGSVEEDEVLQEVGSVLSPEEAEVLRLRVARSLVEDESSSGSVVNSSDRDRGGIYTTQELPDDWLGVEDVSSSLSTVVQETDDFDDTPVRTLNLGDTGSKRVYTFPKREDEVLPVVEEVGTQILSWPVGIAIEIIGFQVKLILQTVSFALRLCSFSFSVITFPFRASLIATNVAVTTAVDGYTLATQTKSMVEQGVAQAGPMLRRTTKKCGFGCLAAVYVMFMLGSLLVPALLLDLFLVRGFIEEPVEFRQILHFDYRQEHPSAIVSLLPPKVLAKVKGNVYPDKVLRARAIPSSHKLQVTVFLTLPESHYNRELGMFQVSAELLSVTGHVLKRTSWPCMLRFQSSSIRYAKQVILGVPLLMGLSGESQTLGLRLFENEEEMKFPTAMVRFILEPKAGFPRGQGLPEVYSAEAQVLSVLPWSKDILRRWKWTFYVWSGLSLFMFEVMVVLCCCHQVLLPSSLLQGITEGFGESETIVKETSVKRVGKPGRRVNFSDDLPTARAIRVSSKPVDKAKERELLLSSAESTSPITRPRLRRLPTPAAIHADMARSEATSSWSIPPPLETLDYVGGKVEAVEGSVKILGATVVDSAAGGVGDALDKVTQVLDPKTLKSD